MGILDHPVLDHWSALDHTLTREQVNAAFAAVDTALADGGSSPGGGGFADAPLDGGAYARMDGAWTLVVPAVGGAYAGAVGFTAPGINFPTMGLTNASYQFAWHDGRIWPYVNEVAQGALAYMADIPLASQTPPVMDGTAAVGVGLSWARADHIHPTDTTRYAASNPSGFQTSAQVTVSLGAYLPLSGAAPMTGGLTTPNLVVTGGTVLIDKGGATNPGIFLNDGSTNRSAFYFDVASGQTTMYDIYSGSVLQLDPSGGFHYSGSGNAFKPGGGTWTAPSDARIKTVQGDYVAGLDQVIALRPVVYTYKGNDTPTADTPSPHARVAADQTPFVGLIAQEVEASFPGMVTRQAGFIDGVAVDDLRNLNTTELIFALVNAIKTLASRVQALEQAA